MLSCNADDKPSNKIFDAIERANSDTCYVDMKTIFGNDVDHFIIIPPYTNTDKLTKKSGIDFSTIRNSNIERRDNIFIICLLKDNKVQQYIIIDRGDMNFTDSITLNKYKADSRMMIYPYDGRHFIGNVDDNGVD